MSTTTPITPPPADPLPPDVMADVQVVADCVAADKPIPADVAQRVRERSDEARRRLLVTHGVQDIGVRIIRELRGELPNP
jgi:hypothetical protein